MDTVGWDTVSGCSMNQANIGLREHLSQLVVEFAHDDGTVSSLGISG